MIKTGANIAWRILRDLFSKEKAARGFDIDACAIKASKGGWLLGALVGFGLEPFYPPTARIGDAGWFVIGALAAAHRDLDLLPDAHGPSGSRRDTLLITAYLGLVNVAAAQWLAGGLPAPYHELYPFMICTAAAVHTPFRFTVFLGLLAGMAVLPELGHATPHMLGDLLTELALWSLAATFIARHHVAAPPAPRRHAGERGAGKRARARGPAHRPRQPPRLRGGDGQGDRALAPRPTRS